MKKNNNKIIIMFLSLMLLFSATSAQAFITFDPTKGVGKIFGIISHYAKQAQETITDLQTQILGSKLVQKGQSAAKYMREQGQKLNDIKSDLEALEGDVRGLSEISQRIYGKAVNTDALKIAKRKTEISTLNKAIRNLEQEKSSLLADYDAAYSKDVAYLNGQIKILQSNNDIYANLDDNEAQDIIQKNNEQIEALEARIAGLSEKTQYSKEQAMIAIDEEIEALSQEKSFLEESLKEYTSGLLTDFLKDTEALTMSRDLNFVAANQELTSDAINRIKENRNAERDGVAKEVFAKAVVLKSIVGKKQTQDFSSAKLNDAYEEVSSNIIMLTSAKIAQIEDLLVYAELMLLDLKFQTAHDLSMINYYEYNEGDRKIEFFDLEDYKFNYNEYKNQQLSNNPISVNSIYRQKEKTQRSFEDFVDDLSGGY